MLLYKDILTGDELFSDAYPMKEIDDVAYEIDCAMVVEGQIEVNTGANASAEGGDDEGTDDTAKTVNNVVHSFRLQQTSFDKKSYVTYIKGYMKALKAKLNETPERVPVFEKNATNLIKKILGNFKDYEFYVGESQDPEGMVALLNYREDGVTPFFTFFKDGLVEQKL